jgi:hypothetical protein
MSQSTIAPEDKSSVSDPTSISEKDSTEHVEFKFLDTPLLPPSKPSSEEIALLRTKVELLELKVEKLQNIVHVRSLLKIPRD